MTYFDFVAAAAIVTLLAALASASDGRFWVWGTAAVILIVAGAVAGLAYTLLSIPPGSPVPF